MTGDDVIRANVMLAIVAKQREEFANQVATLQAELQISNNEIIRLTKLIPPDANLNQ